MSKPLKKIKGDAHRPLPFSKTNWILFCAGILTLVVGYVFLSIGPWNSFWSLTLAPVLLVFGYCVLIPVGILYKKRKPKETIAAP